MLEKFIKFLKPYKWQFILGVTFFVIECAIETILPFLMNNLIKSGIHETSESTYELNLNEIIIIGSIMVGLAIVAFFLGVFGAKFVAISCRGFGYEIRKAEYKKLCSYSFKNIDNFRQSSLITRLTNDVQIISDTLCTSLRPALRAPLMMVMALVFSLAISPQLSLVFLVALVVLTILISLIIHFVKPKFKAIQKMVDNINRVTQESIIAIKTIKAYVKKDYEVLKFNKANEELRSTANKALGINALGMPVGQLANYSTIIAILYFGGILYMQPTHAIMLEDIQTFLTYVMQLLATIIMLSNVLMAINRSSASLYRVNEILETNSEIIDKKDSPLKVEDGSVEFKNVYFKYNESSEKFVLNNINFSIKSGSFVGIIGQTGSSKTTLINLIERFYDVSDGEILIASHNIKDYPIDELRESISLSFQSPTLFKGSVLENLKWGNNNASKEEVIEATKISESYDFITTQLSNSFDTEISQGGTSVSGGQRQRLCIARALIKKPKILILDDSFSALDKITEAKVKENLKTYLPDMTKIVISQKISTIQDADQIIVLNDGKISNIGTHDELLKIDPIYKDIYELQLNGGNSDGKNE